MAEVRQILAAAVCLLSFPVGLSAQSWRELYDSGEYERAAAILHSLVTERRDDGEFYRDVAATEMLGRLYAEGRGVRQDPVFACSLFALGFQSARFRHDDDRDALEARLQDLEADACGRLPAEDRLEALGMTGCLKFDPHTQVFTVDANRWVEVTRRGITVGHHGQRHVVGEIPSDCNQHIALVRYTGVDPPHGHKELAARHFLEVFAWRAGGTQTQARRVLHWFLLEIVGESVEGREAQTIGDGPGPTWMAASVPSELASVSLTMSRSGEVKWRFNRSQFAGEMAALPLERAPETPDDLPPLPTTGTAHVDVTVVDRFGAAVVGAKAKLTGMVAREAQTDHAGRAAFDDLPDGRYDVVADAPGLVASTPHVIDLTGPAVARVALTLKPHAPTGRKSNACGTTIDIRSLERFGAGADMVLHIKVEEQRTVARDTGDMVTTNETRVLQSFKGAGSALSSITIMQAGGRIDRGDYIDSHAHNNLDPLNVGDEYVLFLMRDDKGALWIIGAEYGAFRIRNGRVEPLGAADVGRAWKNRSAVKFFEALQTRIRR